MSAVLRFECRVPVDGCVTMAFDERKFPSNIELKRDELAFGEDRPMPVSNFNEFDPHKRRQLILPPPDSTEDECYLLHKWSLLVAPLGPWRRGSLFFAPENKTTKRELRFIFEPKSARTRSFDIFEEGPTLFLDFANALTTLDSAKVLAERFGPLNAEKPSYVDNWYTAIKLMRSAVIEVEKARATGDYNRVVRMLLHSRFSAVGSHGIDAGISLETDSTNASARLCIRPPTLFHALWTQLALAVDGSQSLHTCIQCKKWFAIDSGRGRSDKRYCSNACRMRAYRKRNAKKVKTRRRSHH